MEQIYSVNVWEYNDKQIRGSQEKEEEEEKSLHLVIEKIRHDDVDVAFFNKRRVLSREGGSPAVCCHGRLIGPGTPPRPAPPWRLNSISPVLLSSGEEVHPILVPGEHACWYHKHNDRRDE
ncbi:unnamed protein product [Discosporangium mesarthrocarpum]